MSQQHANRAAQAAHPVTFSTGEVKPGEDGIPQLIDVQSSNVLAVGFDGGALFVKFAGSKVYRYTVNAHPPADPPVDLAAIHAGMMSAESKGGYFSRHIRRNSAIECVYLGRVTEPGVAAPPAERHENGDGV